LSEAGETLSNATMFSEAARLLADVTELSAGGTEAISVLLLFCEQPFVFVPFENP
jgi:hypothetical protein